MRHHRHRRPVRKQPALNATADTTAPCHKTNAVTRIIVHFTMSIVDVREVMLTDLKWTIAKETKMLLNGSYVLSKTTCAVHA